MFGINISNSLKGLIFISGLQTFAYLFAKTSRLFILFSMHHFVFFFSNTVPFKFLDFFIIYLRTNIQVYLLKELFVQSKIKSLCSYYKLKYSYVLDHYCIF